jgi:branched-chain amino acid transport system ATP-binding protein
MSLNGIAPQLSVRKLHVAYDRDVEILRGVSLTAQAGMITAVIGPNGAGKSTLVRALVGLAPIVDGRVELADNDITGFSASRLLDAGVALVPQERTIFPAMTVGENLQMGGWTRRRDRSWLRARVQSVCEEFPALGERLRERAGNLSGGQQKMLEIARGLIVEPSLLILDEPTSGLAPGIAKQVYEQITELNRRRSVTILLVDQNVRDALAVAGYVYVLAMGRNDAEGTAAELLDRLGDIVRDWMHRPGLG